MSLLGRLRGLGAKSAAGGVARSKFPRPDRRAAKLLIELSMAEYLSDFDGLIEVKVKGTSFRQEVLEQIAGPKEEVGKHFRVGVTLRCEPSNPHDQNAIRVEIMGQHIGYVDRDEAALFAPALAPYGGVLEAQGLIVGGWRNDDSEGHFGCRVWLSSRDSARMGLEGWPSER